MRRLLASPYLVPALLIGVAFTQIGFAYRGALSDWKGGGFGMFATVDRPDNRYVVVTATDRAGRRFSVRPAYGRYPAVKALTVAFVSRTTAFPTASRLQSIAAAVLHAHLVASGVDGARIPARLARSVYGFVLEPAATRARLEMLGPSRTHESVDIASVQVQVFGLYFDPSRSVIALRTIGDPAIAGASEDP